MNPDPQDNTGFWNKIRSTAVAIGRQTISTAFTLYYCLQDPDTPAWAKTTILAALAYLVLPADAVPDLIPVAGYTDDAAALASALAITAAHVKPEHRDRAEHQTNTLFG